MKYLKKIGISLLYSLISFIILLLITSTFSYFNIIKGTILTIFKFLSILISIIIGSFIFGKKSLKKGWLEGLKFGLIILIIFISLNLIFYHQLELRNIIYYTIILSTSILGSMLGITKRRND